MKILVINLPRYRGSSVTRENRCEMLMKYRVDTPETLLIIASVLRDMNNQIAFVDANGLNLSYKNIFNKIKNKDYDCVIFTIASMILDHDLKICKIIKELMPNCITIGYSWYAKKYSKQILSEYLNLDILLIGEPFSIIENLINCLNQKRDLTEVGGIAYRNKNNDIIINQKNIIKKRFDELPLPAYDLIKTFKPYYIYTPLLSPYALVYAGKGCPFSCKYCNMAKTKYSGRSADNIINVLKLLKKIGKIKYIWFFDEIFTLNRKRVIKLCNKMIEEKLKIKWLCDSRVDLVDYEMLKLMKRAGCIGISYGVESGSQTILDLMSKGINIEQAKKAIHWTRKIGIPIQVNLILGYMGETLQTLQETERFIKTTLPNVLQITKMMALADTEFNEIATKKGWINKSTNWKTGLKSAKTKLSNYQPYDLDLWGERKKLFRILYFNPKWWVLNLRTLIKNPILIFLMIATFIKRIFDKNMV